MGLPGSGKTTLCKKLLQKYPNKFVHLNADEIRQSYNDWDFSEEGRLRQTLRMSSLSEDPNKKFLCDFVCPTERLRNVFNPSVIIWMDTIQKSRFEDTNNIFECPSKYHYRIKNYNEVDFLI